MVFGYESVTGRTCGAWLCLCLLALTGCRTLRFNEPEWVRNPKAVYPESRYLAAVGEGDSRRAAENAATANLARIFEAHIESDERVVDTVSESERDFTRTTDLTTDINILSSQTLVNIQHAEAWKDAHNRYHAVAYLDRRGTARIYLDEIEELNARVEFLRNSAAMTDDPLKRYAALRTAVGCAGRTESLLRQLRIIHSSSAGSVQGGCEAHELRAALTRAAGAVSVSIAVEGDRETRILTMLEQFITGYGFVVGTPAALNLDGRISVKDTGERTQELVFVRYELDLRIRNRNGDVLVTLNTRGREAHHSLDQARTRSIRTLENAIMTDGTRRLDAYFDALIDL